MYVITHKKTSIPNIDGYFPILVGADIHPNIKDYDIKDNNGENISNKNPNYCELTGVYWIWKNEQPNIIGISHYRRFFSRKSLSGGSKFFLSKENIDQIMRNKRIILPKARYYQTNIISVINRAPNMNDLKEMSKAIQACYPEYMKDYVWFLKQNKAHLYNMFVMRWKDFNDYCEWLFEILSYIEERHDMSAETDNYRLRLYGFLSERLLSVWVHHNIKNTEIEYFSVVNTEETFFERNRHLVGNIKRNLLYKLYSLSKRKVEVEDKLINTVVG